MPIFSIDPTQNVNQIPLNVSYFKDEAALRDFFADNLAELLGIRFLAKEFQTPDGRIDTLGLDENDSPVILEYKWGQDNAIFTQGLFYYAWLRRNRSHFDLLTKSKIPSVASVNWSRPRVLLIAQGFDNRTLVAAQEVDYVELVRYTPYGDHILYVENLSSQKAARATKVSEPVNAAGDDETPSIYTLNYHFTKAHSTDSVQQMFFRLQEMIKALPSTEEIVNQKTGVTYRTTRSFARIEFGGKYLSILVRRANHTDPHGLLQDITSHEWGYKGRIKLETPGRIDAAFAIIRESYEETL